MSNATTNMSTNTKFFIMRTDHLLGWQGCDGVFDTLDDALQGLDDWVESAATICSSARGVNMSCSLINFIDKEQEDLFLKVIMESGWQRDSTNHHSHHTRNIASRTVYSCKSL